MTAEPRIVIPASLSPRAFAEREASGTVQTLSGATMGTTWSARIVAPETALPMLKAVIQTALDEVVRDMSTWETGSAISRFNRAPAGSWHALPQALFHVLTAGYDIAEASNGAFDPTAGALVDLWGFGPAPATLAPPSPQQIEDALARGGWHRLALDRAARRAQQPGAMRLDLSAIAKGYGVDAASERLRANGIRHFLIEVGGELRGEGIKPDGQPWWVDIEAPPGLRVAPTRVALHNLSIATSGDYRRFFDHGQRRYAHSLDPRTGMAADNGLAAVTVLHPSCMLADAWATALIVSGPDEGPRIAEAHGLAALFLSRARADPEIITTAFASLLD